ncbi:M23 family metallopeptidase [Thermoanaerobacterium saccharolyticum]|uniref:Murein DD-endopeptidase MepM/ murein hydrolase activator NlpD n=1 Tax=Thermoanaerobacterium butyriciformans TaxID=1702242 RepID=A0ABS4NEF9_9THEO|nr:M23 family metallopeptidase [Thermoanaerobacterium butyriciformans]MBP2071395.1 murein DD-endopeptidase MepM/ murein hydrolase activator NlpD [Thermoanaerobacterium butyriciformans]
MQILGKVLIAFLPDDFESALKFALLFIFIPIVFLTLVFAGPITAYEKVPLVSYEQVQMYISIAEKVSESTKNPYSDGVEVDWKNLVAIDAVRFNQDFSKANRDEIEELAKMFVEITGYIEVKKGDDVVRYPIYRLRSIDEVLNMLNFTKEQKNKVKEFLSIDFSEFLDSPATDISSGWTPVENELKWPLSGGYAITSGFGTRIDPVYGGERYHSGIDIAVPLGTPVKAAADGEVVYAGWNDGYGLVVFIWHNNNLETRYAHLSKIAVNKGQIVKAGDVIGYVGSTGKSTGPHLHFEVRNGGKAVNPLDFFK